MKTLIISIALFLGLALIVPVSSSAQCCAKQKSCGEKKACADNKTKSAEGVSKESIKVYGKCGMCKTRIETAAKTVKGVTTATWNDATNTLSYSFNGTVKKEDVSNALIAVGHDTELGKAKDDVYNKLPGCCKYRN